MWSIQFHASFVNRRPWELEDEAKTETMNKYIVCDFARGNWGKTNTLLKVIELLKEKTTPIVEDLIGEVDKYAAFKLNGKKIIINTQGDPNSYQKEGLLRAVSENADIIVCSSRTKGATVDCIYEVAGDDYDIIWFSNFHSDLEDLPCVPYFPEIDAEAIVKLIQKL